jgi:hypothetical protein
MFSLKGSEVSIHGGETHFEPYELPVEVEVVCQAFATFESSVLNATLALGRGRGDV